MADHTQHAEWTTITAPSSGETSETDTNHEGGLRSLGGIRWLLLAGALVTAVSLFRLVESQWELMPVVAQYLVVVVGALGLYSTGEFSHRRLHLPLVGSALMLLFTAMVPVLSWGAVYLDLLSQPWGWLVFVLGTTALLGAARRPLERVLGYRGILYPAIFAIFILIQPVLPEIHRRFSEPVTTVYIGAALVLGALLHAGSRHINRFFFHRDRQDGVDRPIQWMPFIILGVLYLSAMFLLDPRSEFVALPLAVIGMVLADTGAEYYRALIRSRGEKPERWPKRSVALMTIGVAAIVVALPLSFMDPSLRCSALVSICAAFFFGRWSLQSPGFSSNLAALGSVFAAYHLFPALVPDLAKKLWAQLLAALDLSQGSPLALSIADFGFLLILIAWSGLLRSTGAFLGLRRLHAGIAVIYIWWLSVLAMVDPADSTIFLALLGVVGLVGLVASRRQEFVIGIPGVSAALVLTLAQRFLGEPQLLTAATLSALGLVTLLATLIVRWIEVPVTRLLGINGVVSRRLLLLPATVIAAVIAIHSLVFDLGRNDLGSLELMVAGLVFVSTGIGLRNRFLPVLGGVSATLGLHVLIFDLTGTVGPVLVLTTQLLAVLSLWAVAVVARVDGPLASLLRPAAFVLALAHCLLGLWWLLLAVANWNLTVEPVILAVLGLLAADVGLTTRTRTNVITGGLLVAVFGGLQFLAVASMNDWTVAIPASLVAVALALVPMILLGCSSPRSWLQRHYALDKTAFESLVPDSVLVLTSFWIAISVVACLFFSGPAALILALSMVVVEAVARIELKGPCEVRHAVSLRLLLVFLLQLVVMLLGSGATVMPLALTTLGFDLLAPIAVAVLGWRLLGHVLGRSKILTGWSLAVEIVLALFIVAAAVGAPELAMILHMVVVATAVALAMLRVFSGSADPKALHSWMAQIWIGLAGLHGFTAGWLHLEGAAAPWVLLMVAVAEYGLAVALKHTGLGAVFGPACRFIGFGLPMVAWVAAMIRTEGLHGPSVWLAALPAFAVSLFYAVIAMREGRTTAASLAASITFGWAFLAVVILSGLGFEYNFLAPGISLMALAALLRPRIGSTWSSYLATAGAACLYATPIVALSEQVSWMWLAVLLVMTVAIGSACIALRSRSLLVVSTAAMLTDLGFFVFKIGTTEPLLLWVFGLAFGLALMAFAGYLEYQREGLLQQVRVFGRELKSWN